MVTIFDSFHIHILFTSIQLMDMSKLSDFKSQWPLRNRLLKSEEVQTTFSNWRSAPGLRKNKDASSFSTSLAIHSRVVRLT